jgi:hypothetical protein
MESNYCQYTYLCQLEKVLEVKNCAYSGEEDEGEWNQIIASTPIFVISLPLPTGKCS